MQKVLTIFDFIAFFQIYEKSTSGFLVGDSLTLADLCWLEVFLWVVELVPELSSSFPRMTVSILHNQLHQI